MIFFVQPTAITFGMRCEKKNERKKSRTEKITLDEEITKSSEEKRVDAGGPGSASALRWPRPVLYYRLFSLSTKQTRRKRIKERPPSLSLSLSLSLFLSHFSYRVFIGFRTDRRPWKGASGAGDRDPVDPSVAWFTLRWFPQCISLYQIFM